jgi:hypothetical protein
MNYAGRKWHVFFKKTEIIPPPYRLEGVCQKGVDLFPGFVIYAHVEEGNEVLCTGSVCRVGWSGLWAQSPDCTEKPWTYWWWMGSSVNKEDITEQMEGMAEAGLGGVHIIPIYGEKGDEEHFIPYLSEQWMEMLEHTIREARRLGMDVDMTMGTGWHLAYLIFRKVCGPSVSD